jgi:predicted transglutaminase-like protease
MSLATVDMHPGGMISMYEYSARASVWETKRSTTNDKKDLRIVTVEYLGVIIIMAFSSFR